jgi:carbamoyltransferase
VVRENVFDDVWMPACEGDASGALGAALFTQFQLLDAVRRASAHDSLKGSLLGPRFNNETIHGFLRSQQIEHDYCPDESELLQKTAAVLREGKTVGWFQGRMEFGTHALGARSILREGK